MYVAKVTKPLICTPGKGRCGPENLVLDLNKASEIIIPWGVKLIQRIPEITITMNFVNRMNLRGHYTEFFFLQGPIVIPAKKSKGTNSIQSECLAKILIVNDPPLGSYYMHFKAKWNNEETSGPCDFYQKIQLVRR